MYIVKTEDSFDSAHFLARYNGKCRNIHGHRWRVVIEIAGENLDDGMVVDFTDIKAALKALTDNLDHSLVMEKDTLKPQTYECLVDEGFRIMIMDFRPTQAHHALPAFHVQDVLIFNVELLTVCAECNFIGGML